MATPRRILRPDIGEVGVPIALVIFDCDGVLIDSEVISASVLIEEAAAVGIRLTREYVRDHFLGRSFPTVAATIRAEFGRTLPVDFEARYRASLLERFETGLRLTPGVTDVIARLRVPYCVATSSSPPRLARSLAISGLDRWFAHRFTASEVARGKPAPDLFLHASARMGVAPADCLVIEDSRPGIEAARSAGMQAALYTGGSHMGGKGFDTGADVVAFDDWAGFVDLWPDAIDRAETA
jgi:HAD superfamily hydrolase (TIGR01509 family)